MNTKIKLLSLALMGLVGYSFAGAAAAACPTSPVPPWTSTFSSPGSSFVVANGGLDGSECKAVSTVAGSLAGAATVTDDTPSNESSYRFQFLVDADALGQFGLTHSAVIFRAASAAAANGATNMLTVYMVGASGGAKTLRFVASCGSAANFKCTQNSTVPLSAGVNRIEGFLTTGATGKFDYWVNAAPGTTAPAVTGTIPNLQNGAWVGVNRAVMGVSGPTSAFAGAHAGQGVSFDTFDSRRTSYIGH